MRFPSVTDWALWNGSSWGAFAAFTLGWGLRFAGRELLPRTGPVLIVSNHQSFIDPILVGLVAPRPLTYLARSTLFKSRLGSSIIRRYGAVPIDRGFGREGLQAVFDALERGGAVLMFPEGERTYDGNLQELKAGVSLLVKRAAAPIVPVGIAGAYDVWPRTAKYPRMSPLFLPDNGCSISVVFGEPLPTGFYRQHDREAILTDLRERINTTWTAAKKIQRK